MGVKGGGHLEKGGAAIRALGNWDADWKRILGFKSQVVTWVNMAGTGVWKCSEREEEDSWTIRMLAGAQFLPLKCLTATSPPQPSPHLSTSPLNEEPTLLYMLSNLPVSTHWLKFQTRSS